METPRSENDTDLSELRLLLEELCCDLCRFKHVTEDRLAPESIRIDREVNLGMAGAFADISVVAPGRPAYVVEVKYGYSDQDLLKHLRRKYGTATAPILEASRLVLVIDCEARPGWQALEAQLHQCLRSGLELEVWSERRLLGMLREQFGVDMEAITKDNLLDIRQAVDRAKGFHAFGGPGLAEYQDDPFKSALVWHFGFWQLRQFQEKSQAGLREILRPGHYRDTVVVLGDLCSFSSYVRDTRDDKVVRHSLTSFYSKARYQIINNGGMFYQFVGDEVIGLFGVPELRADHAPLALRTARSLLDIGDAISHHWQRHIDRMQESGGLHVGMAVGDLQIVALRPFSRTYMGAIGDPINVAARLMAAAGPGEIVVSNSFYNALDEAEQAPFQETQPLEARNVGRIKAWKWSPRHNP